MSRTVQEYAFWTLVGVFCLVMIATFIGAGIEGAQAAGKRIKAGLNKKKEGK